MGFFVSAVDGQHLTQGFDAGSIFLAGFLQASQIEEDGLVGFPQTLAPLDGPLLEAGYRDAPPPGPGRRPRAPARIFVAVRAIAPLTANPPNSPEKMLATP